MRRKPSLIILNTVAHYAAVWLLAMAGCHALAQQTAPENQPIVADNLKRVTGTNVSLIVPPDFEPSTTFTGFEQAKTSSRIVVLQITRPYSFIAEGYDPEYMEKKGMFVQTKESVTASGLPGMLIYAVNRSQGDTLQESFGQWMLYFGDERETIGITAYFPLLLEKLMSEPLRRSLLSARWDKDKAVDPFDDIPFEVKETPSLRYQTRVQRLLIYAGTKLADLQPGDALAFVGPEPPEINVLTQEDCEPYLTSQPQFADVVLESNEPITISGLKGCKMLATALEVKHRVPVFLYVVVLFDRENIFIVWGKVGVAQREKYVGEFQSFARSLKKKPAKP